MPKASLPARLAMLLVVPALALVGCRSAAEPEPTASFELLQPSAEPTSVGADPHFVSAAHGYEVDFPSAPQQQQTIDLTEDSTMELVLWVGTDDRSYMVQALETGEPIPAEEMAEGLVTVLSEAVQGGGGMLASDPEVIELGGLPGVSSRIVIEGLSGRVVVVGTESMIYILMAVGGEAAGQDAFIDSWTYTG